METIVAALLTIAASFAISWYTSKREAKSRIEELEKGTQLKLKKMKQETHLRLEEMKKETTRTYSEQLLQKRIQIYPLVNENILRFMHSIRAEGMKQEHLLTLYDNLRDWEVAHSLLLGDKARVAYSNLLKFLRVALSEGKTELGILKSSIDCIGQLRLALKYDLGIPLVDTIYPSYDQMFAHQEEEEQDPAVDEELEVGEIPNDDDIAPESDPESS